MSLYDDMDDEDKVLLAIDFVAKGTPIPDALRTFLNSEGLLEKIEAPKED